MAGFLTLDARLARLAPLDRRKHPRRAATARPLCRWRADDETDPEPRR
ncbi:MAG TPA: hypothetical protein VFA03_08800 [Acetobacteraceae bacterium]|nr:hypothetical protein [Acetobacteraceae bacterium]